MIDNFKEYKNSVDARLEKFISAQSERSKNSNRKFTYSLYEPVNYVMAGGGKRIRPILVLLCCEAFGGNVKEALNAAIAVEILHNFTLVHDDIMDNADTRRGKQTVHKKWDISSAILVGDELIGLSYRSLLETKTGNIPAIVKVFTDGVIEVCEGQAMDKEFESSTEVCIDDYIIMIKKKTAELLKTSAVIGALIGGAGDEDIEHISTYAQNIGLAFQIQDDLLDVIGNNGKFGKTIGGDIIEKKKTYMYLKAMEILKGGEKNKFTELYNSDLATPDKVNEIIDVYNRVCVVESARNEIKKFTDTANKSLACVKNREIKLKLEQFSDMLLKRNY